MKETVQDVLKEMRSRDGFDSPRYWADRIESAMVSFDPQDTYGSAAASEAVRDACDMLIAAQQSEGVDHKN